MIQKRLDSFGEAAEYGKKFCELQVQLRAHILNTGSFKLFVSIRVILLY